MKLRSTKSLKVPQSKKTYREDPLKQQDTARKKKIKDGNLAKDAKKNKSTFNKFGYKTKASKTKSESGFDCIPLSEIKK